MFLKYCTVFVFETFMGGWCGISMKTQSSKLEFRLVLANKNISVWDQLMSDTSTHVIPLNCLQKPPRCVKYVESN